MKARQHTIVLEQLFIQFVFFLTNLPALLTAIWLIPAIVLGKSAIIAICSFIALWLVYNMGQMGQFYSIFLRNWFIVPFTLFSFLSIFWSVQQEISISYWIILFSTMIISACLGIRFSHGELLTFLSFFGLLVMFISTIFIIFVPSLGIMNYYSIQGAWRGMFWHKNHMGVIAAFFNLVFLFKAIVSIQSPRKKFLFWGSAYVYTLIFLFKTDSVGSYLSAIFVHGVFIVLLLWMKYRKFLKRKHYFILIVIVVMVFAVLFFNLETFFGIFNRQTNLTGRIPMWSYMFKTYFSKRPVFGYGLNAFWHIEEFQTDLMVAAGYPDAIIISDNGFIDILINTGIIGFGLFALLYLGLWYRSFEGLKSSDTVVDLFPITLMAFSFIGNLSWSLLFENESFLMLVLMIFLFNNKRKELQDSNESKASV